MFDVLIRELGARFGLNDKSSEFLRIVLAYMTNKETGGLIGFLEKFKAAGLGPVVQSWLGNTVSPQALSHTQVETVFGSSGGLLDLISRQIDAPRDNMAGALAYLIPGLVAKLTPGGSMPSSLPAEIAGFVGDPQSVLAPLLAPVVEKAGGGLMKWVPWAVGAVAVLLGLSYCTEKPKSPDASELVPVVAPAASAEVPASAAEVVASEPASAPAQTPGSEPAATAAPVASEGMVVLEAVPDGAAVVAGNAHGIPLVQVFFDSGKVDVASDFAAKSAELLAHLKAHADAKAVISGFSDTSGDAAQNAALSKQRAQAVQAALVAQGIDEARTVLEKPVDAAGVGMSNAAARRVDVVIRN